MFDSGLRSASDAAVVSAIQDLARHEAETAARRIAAISELVRRRCGDDERAYWACDPWDAAAAEIGAALGISRGRASGEMHLGLSLRYRLPQVAELFTEGLISHRVCSVIADRTDLIQDRTALDRIDTVLAEHARSWGVLSVYKMEKAIDAWVDQIDPGALHQTRSRARDRDVQFGAQHDTAGSTSVRGRLYATDAALLDRRLMQMARGVCDDDPRTTGQRRADALGALAAGSDRLACQCGSPTCPASGDDGRSAAVVIHVVTDADVDAIEPDPNMSGEGFGTVDSPADPPARKSTATLTGRGGIVPTPMLAELIRGGATVRHVRQPSDQPEPGYRPSAALAEFVRFRDLTCRFPNCDVPAEFCDIDHTIPWPLGPTHPSNLKCTCRKEHLLKTFWEGWSEIQFPDGTVEWTSPTGNTYVTHPGSRVFFPQWDVTTSPLPPPKEADPSHARTLMMPTRRRTRAQDRARYVRRERALNDARVAERNKPPPF
ncbi:DUF222 domain-containing protein [Mycobacterium sp. NBC_00419]|uniref:DUF222 domain-containing protein n=1 Tax=Mycobacterium sp. NBC_00419 TaxID=2975989 RepID=UPI002E1BDC43